MRGLIVSLLLVNMLSEGYSDVLPRNLTVCFMWESDSYYSSYERVAAFVDLAIYHANNYVLNDAIRLRKVYRNAGPACVKSQSAAVTAMYGLLQSGETCHLIIGASCPYTTVALYGFAEALDIAMMSIPGAGVTYLQSESSSATFPLLIQPTFSFSDFSKFLIDLLVFRKFIHMTIIRDESFSFFANLVETLSKTMRDINITMFRNTNIVSVRSLRANADTYRQILESANERSRMMLIFGHADCVRSIMLVAQSLGYTKGEHVFIAAELFDLPSYWGRIDPTIGDTTDSNAASAYQSLLVAQLLDDSTRGTEEEIFNLAVTRLAHEKYNYTFGALESIDVVLRNHYEAIMVYASVLYDLLEDNLNYTDGEVVVGRMSNNSFKNPLGGIMHFGNSRQREKGYILKHYNAETDKYETVIQFKPHNNISFRRMYNYSWPNRKNRDELPPDEPVCGYRNNKCQLTGLSPATLGLAVGLPLIFIASVVAIGAYVFLQFWQSRLDFNPNWWRINVEDLDIKSPRAASSSKKTLRSQHTGASKASTHYSAYMCDLFAIYSGTMVGLIDVTSLKQTPTRELIDELKLIKKTENPNLQHFTGIAISPDNICQYIVGEICSKGTLTNVLESPVIKLDWFFKNLIIRDLVSGMTYLHSTPIASHGNLSSNTCQLDNRFTLKISDYGLSFFRKKENLIPPKANDYERDWEALLWRAPELLRQTMPAKGTQKGDVYSFAIILQQVILRSGPFELPDDPLDLSPREIALEVIAANIPPVRPRVPRSSCSNELYDLMERCWEEVPLERPTFQKVKERLQKIIGNVGDNVIDSLFKRMEQYASDLEQKVAEQTQQFMDEKMRSEQLLGELLPKPVAAALTKGLTVEPEAFDSVTVFFSDIVGFTTISSKGTPLDVIELLNKLYTFFDEVLMRHDVYKVETIGDAYMVASGLPIRNGNKHVIQISGMALEVVAGIAKFVVPHLPTEPVHIRVGINSGPCVAGIVGKKMPRYCLFGDTVNTASRMESTSEPMRIQIGSETRRLLDQIGGFTCSERGEVPIKGKGVVVTHWLLGKLH